MRIETFTRNEHCNRCSKPVAIRCPVGKNPNLSVSMETILCPWCGHSWTLEIPGQLLWVEKRL
jgi:transcription elongation factor Elf1